MSGLRQTPDWLRTRDPKAYERYRESILGGDKGAGEKVAGRAVHVRQERVLPVIGVDVSDGRQTTVTGVRDEDGVVRTISLSTEYPVAPVTKPRQTRRDRWAKRPCVLRYRAYADELRNMKAKLPDSGAHVTFVLPMPKSWGAKKKAAHDEQPHTQKPDADNLLKAYMDAIHKNDCGVWDVRVTKLWGRKGAIRVAYGSPT